MAEESPFPKYDIAKFTWKLPADDSKRAVREAAGGEVIQDIWNRLDQGDGMLFLALYLNLPDPIQETVLTAAAKETWAWLRFQIPTIAARTENDEKDNTLMVYSVATDDEVQDWVGRTLRVTKQSTIDLDKLRYDVGSEKIPSESGDQTFLYFVPGPAATDGTVSSFGLLLHSHHIVACGAGAKSWLNRYLGHLASVLSAPADVVRDKLPWGTEAANLLPCIYQVMGPSEALPIPSNSSQKPTADDPYYANLEEILDGLANGFENSHGLKERPLPTDTQDGNDWPKTRRIELRFTKEESDLIFKKRRPASESGTKKGYTINQIAHAALSMATIHDNPPNAKSNPDGIVHYVAIADGRSRLREPYSARDGFPGHCLAMSPMAIPLKAYQTDDGSAVPLDKSTLVMSVRRMKELYERQKAYPALLSVVAQQMDILVEQLRFTIAAGIVLPPSRSPWLSADGMGEKHLDVAYPDEAGKPIIAVDDFFVSVNKTAPGPFCRIKSWKGLIDLSVDFNEKVMPREVMEEFIMKWKEFMLLVSEFDDEDYV